VKVGNLVRQPLTHALGVVVEVKIPEPNAFTAYRYRVLWLDSQKYTTHWSTKWLEVVDA